MSDLPKDEMWKIHDSSQHYIDLCNQRQWDQDAKFDKWILTLAAGSFGLSFAFIDKIVVPLPSSSHRGLLLAAWVCFTAVLVLELYSFIISSLTHSDMVREERKNIVLKYQGKAPEYKTRSVFLNNVAVCGYAALSIFVGGVICLFLFIAKNFVG